MEEKRAGSTGNLIAFCWTPLLVPVLLLSPSLKKERTNSMVCIRIMLTWVYPLTVVLNPSLHAGESDVQTECSFDSTLVAGVTTETTCSVNLVVSIVDMKFSLPSPPLPSLPPLPSPSLPPSHA